MEILRPSLTSPLARRLINLIYGRSPGLSRLKRELQLRDSAGFGSFTVIANEVKQSQFKMLRHTSTSSV
jgi:hypothetical protein